MKPRVHHDSAKSVSLLFSISSIIDMTKTNWELMCTARRRDSCQAFLKDYKQKIHSLCIMRHISIVVGRIRAACAASDYCRLSAEEGLPAMVHAGGKRERGPEETPDVGFAGQERDGSRAG